MRMQFVHHSRQKMVCTGPPVRATALINQLVGHLLPAMSYCSYDHLVRDEYIVEHHLIEIVLSGQIDDRPDRYAGQRKIDEELADAFAAAFAARSRSREQNHHMDAVGIARPHLAAGNPPTTRNLLGDRKSTRRTSRH